VTLDLDFKVMVNYIDALDVLCAQLTRDLFAIAKFLFVLQDVCETVSYTYHSCASSSTYVTYIVNSSLRQGRLPDSQKHAVVTPLLKRPGLDTADMANYRPVSNMTFMSKIVERAVTQQLHQYLDDNDLLPRYQSAYRRHHSTETAKLRVLSDVLTAADAQQVTLLGLLNLSSAFDCVDHQLLL